MSSIKMKATTINATIMRKFCFPPDRLIISFVFCVTKSNRCVVLSKSFSISSSILLIRKREKINKSPSHCVSRKGKQGQGKFKNKKISLWGTSLPSAYTPGYPSLTYSDGRVLPISPTKEHPGGRHSYWAFPDLHPVVSIVAAVGGNHHRSKQEQ